jgi:transposase
MKISWSPVQARRAELISLSLQGMRVPRIACALRLSRGYVRLLIRRYNREGLAALRTRPRRGRTPVLTPAEQSLVVRLAETPPEVVGQPFAHWSVRKLRAYLASCGLIPRVSLGTVRSVLAHHQHQGPRIGGARLPQRLDPGGSSAALYPDRGARAAADLVRPRRHD